MSTKDEKEPLPIVARLDVIEEEENVVTHTGKLPLTAAEIAVLEAEKAQMLREFDVRRREEYRPVPSPFEAPEAPIEIPPSPELEELSHQQEAMDGELRKLDDERRTLESNRIESLKADERVHLARRSALQAQRNEIEKKARVLRTLHANKELARRKQQVADMQKRADAKRDAERAQRNQELTTRISPLVIAAKRVLAELQQISKEHLGDVQDFVRTDWADMPQEWPYELKVEFNQRVKAEADKLDRLMRQMTQGLGETIKDAERLIAQGWQADQAFRMNVNEVVRNLGYSTEYVRSVRQELEMLNGNLASIFERGGHAEDMVKSGAHPMPKPIVVMTAEERGNVMMEARMAQQWEDVAHEYNPVTGETEQTRAATE